jgi:hypothetical protein
MNTNVYPVTHADRTFTPGGEIPELAEPGTRLDCGHRRPRRSEPCSVFPGYVIRHGRTMCRWCANRAELRDFRRADRHVAYLTGQHPRYVTGYLGVQLARITRHEVSRRIWMPGGWGSYRLVTIRAEDSAGGQWYGRGTDSNCIIRLRRFTGTPRWDR